MMSKHHLEKLVRAFISNRLGCCSGPLTGLSQAAIRQLQLIQSVAARVVTSPEKSSATPLLRSRHRLARIIVENCIAGP